MLKNRKAESNQRVIAGLAKYAVIFRHDMIKHKTCLACTKPLEFRRIEEMQTLRRGFSNLY